MHILRGTLSKGFCNVTWTKVPHCSVLFGHSHRALGRYSNLQIIPTAGANVISAPVGGTTLDKAVITPSDNVSLSSYLPFLRQIVNMGEDDSCSCRTPDLNEKYPEAECQGCGKPKRLSDDDLADPRSSTSWRPITTPRWALNLSWPKPESSELQQFTSHIQINGDNDVADRVANFLRGKETPHDSSQISSGVDDNAAPSVDVGKLSLSSKDGLEALPKGDYAYDRLGSSKSKNLLDHWFRLLRISPYSKGGPVHGFLERYTLREAPRFEALSYTWSDEFEKPEDEDRRRGRPLFIGKHFQRLAVTRNCENALQRLRNLGKEYVWIDAVCINQSDLNDKKQQIALMHQIYSRAAKVLIYLGP